MNKELWFNGPGDTTTACCFDNMTNPNNYPPCSPGELQATSCGAIIDYVQDPIDDTPDGEIGTLDIRDTEPNVVGTNDVDIDSEDVDAIVDAEEDGFTWDEGVSPADLLEDWQNRPGPPPPSYMPPLPEDKLNPAFKWLLIAGIGVILWRQFNR